MTDNPIHNHGDKPSRPTLSVLDAVCIMTGVVIGVGIFRAPSIVAANVATDWGFLLCWGAGAAISLIGALCYAELATAHPDAGGEYHFLTRAYGHTVGFFFAWGRLSVIQTGAIATVAYVLGDYLSQLLPLGTAGSATYAALAVAVLTAFNLQGMTPSKWLQNALMAAIIATIGIAIAAGLLIDPVQSPSPEPSTGASHNLGFAMIFVLLTFGGWNEAVYLSAEVRDVRKNMVRILAIGIAIIAGVYLLLNLAYLKVLGLEGMRTSEALANDLVHLTLGERAATIITLIIAAASITTLNATIVTGARSTYAFGRDFALFGRLGHWSGKAPVAALLTQGAIAILLIGLGAFTRTGFVTMVEYTAPVFWLFFFVSTCSLFIFRRRAPHAWRPFSVPLYPIIPAIFCIVCLYMLRASLVYTGIGALFGAAVLIAGLPLLFWSRRIEKSGWLKK